MPPKPPPDRDSRGPTRFWFASHRVRRGQWQATQGEDWYPIRYEDVPDQLWSMKFKRDGWTFYTDRTRECDEHGFPIREKP